MIPLSVLREYMPKLKDEDLKELGPVEYDQSKVPEVSKKHAENVRRKVYLPDMAESFARGVEYAGLMSSEAEIKANNADLLSKDTQNRFNDQIAGTTDSDEVIDARRPEGGESYQTLGSRLDGERNKIYENLSYISLNIKSFGAVGDGVNDDRAAIQRAIDAVRALGGGDVLIPYAENFWNIASVGDNNAALNVPKGVNIISKGSHYGKNRLYVTTEININTVINLIDGGGTNKINNLYIDCNKKANYGIATNGLFVPYLNFENVQVLNPLSELGVNIQTFMSTFNRVGVQGGSLKFFGSNSTSVRGTSVHLENCYATNVTKDQGGIILELLTYSKITTSGSDHNNIGYELVNCNTVTIENSGVEHCLTPYKIKGSQNIKVSTPSIVSTEIETYAIFEIEDSQFVTLGNMHANDRNWQYHVLLKGNTSRVIYEDSSINLTDNQSTATVSKSPLEMQFMASKIQTGYLKAGLTGAITGNVEFKKNDVGIVSLKGTVVPTRTITNLEKISTIIDGYRPAVNTLIPVLNSYLGSHIGWVTLNKNGDLVVEKNTTLTEGSTYVFNTSFERNF